MISVRVHWGNGSRVASLVSDKLISSDAMSRIRAGQILSGHMLIIKERVLSTPHDPLTVVGVRKEFYNSKLGISGMHLITARSLSLSSDSATDSISIEKYGRMLP
jgi:hypothetical protein